MEISFKSHLVSFLRTSLATFITLFWIWVTTLTLNSTEDFKMSLIVLCLSCLSWAIWAGLKTLWMTTNKN